MSINAYSVYWIMRWFSRARWNVEQVASMKKEDAAMAGQDLTELSFISTSDEAYRVFNMMEDSFRDGR